MVSWAHGLHSACSPGLLGTGAPSPSHVMDREAALSMQPWAPQHSGLESQPCDRQRGCRLGQRAPEDRFQEPLRAHPYRQGQTTVKTGLMGYCVTFPGLGSPPPPTIPACPPHPPPHPNMTEPSHSFLPFSPLYTNFSSPLSAPPALKQSLRWSTSQPPHSSLLSSLRHAALRPF